MSSTEQVALITGIAGQDGSYLAESLIARGFDVHGVVRRNSVPEHQGSRLDHLGLKVTTHYGDVTDSSSILRLLREIGPTHVFNLAAQSHVRISFDVPEYTLQANAVGLLNVLEAMRIAAPTARLYQASSSEIFGTAQDPDGFQRETTPMLAASPYGVAKLAAFHLVRTYRDGYGLFAANGILFNHESPRRGSNFVSNKVVTAAAKIALGKQEVLYLGNLESRRDWGHSRDYVEAMQLIIDADLPDDFVVATGETWSVRDLCEIAFSSYDLDYRQYVRFDERLLRPKEVPHLRGDSSKIRQQLGWEPKVSFPELIREMAQTTMDRLLTAHGRE